jgi:hypothetical protein
LIEISTDSITPWLVGGLALLVFLALSITFKSWREAKRSPYFFLRAQAARRTQKYFVISIGLLLLTIATTTYAWQAPEDTTPRVAVLNHAKPVSAETVPELAAPEGDLVTEIEVDSPKTVEISLSGTSDQIGVLAAGLTDPLLRPSLPEEYDQFEAAVELKDSTTIGDISFSTDVSDDYQAIDPGRRFTTGYFTLYGTFSYEDFEDGMVWSWLWKRNGQVIEGGNQVWSYGDDGPGYVYLKPEEGFAIGEYVMEVWVNGELFTQANFTITDGISASN